MTHRQAAAFGSPVFRIGGPAPPAYSPCLSSARSRFVRRDPPDLVQHQLSLLIPCTTNRPTRSPTTARRARPPSAPRASLGASAQGYRTLRVVGRVTFQRRRRGDRTQREAGPFRVPPPSYPRMHGGVGRPASRESLFCFCERILHTWAPLMRTLTR